MQPLPQVGLQQAPLTQQQWQQIQEEIVLTVRKQLIGRRVMSILNLNDLGVITYSYDKQTDMSDASMGMKIREEVADIIGLTRKNLDIPVLYKSFILSYRDLLSSQRFGTPLDSSNAVDAGRRVAELEETLIWQGQYNWQGFLNLTGRQTRASAGTWATAGNAYTDVKNATSDLANAGYPGPYALIVTPRQWADLLLLFANTGITQLEKIQALAQAGVFISNKFASDADAILTDPSPSNYRLLMAQDVQTYRSELKNRDLYVLIYEAIAPLFYAGRETSIVDITGITV